MEESQRSFYIRTAVALTILSILELGVNHLPVPNAARVAILLAFAATKVMLVAMIYMHLRYETKALKIAVFIPIPLAILFTLALVYDLPYQYIF